MSKDMRVDILLEEGLVELDEEDNEVFHITKEGWATAFLDLLATTLEISIAEAMEIAYEEAAGILILHVAEDFLHNDLNEFLENPELDNQ